MTIARQREERRQKLFGHVFSGRITAASANRVAARLGLWPISTDAPDPRETAFWSLPMAVCWVAWGDYDEVWLQAGSSFNFSTTGEKTYRIETNLLPSIRDLGVTAAARAAFNGERNAMEALTAAKAKLWRGLGAGELQAFGFDERGDYAPIPAHLWPVLKERVLVGNGCELEIDGPGAKWGTAYRSVQISRQSLLQWPPPPTANNPIDDPARGLVGTVDPHLEPTLPTIDELCRMTETEWLRLLGLHSMGGSKGEQPRRKTAAQSVAKMFPSAGILSTSLARRIERNYEKYCKPQGQGRAPKGA